MIQGQDWSSYQSSTPSTKGLDFVIVKATEGAGYVNPRMTAQAAHARAAGLVVGFYHFLRPGNMKAQAAYFVSRADSKDGDLLVADWEDNGVSNADKNAFIAEVQRLRPGHRVGLYCNVNFWKNKDVGSKCGDFLWIAHYGVAQGKPGIQDKWLIHQYSETPVDKNVATFASRAAMREWADKEPVSPAPDAPKPPQKPAAGQASKLLAIAKGEVGYREGKNNYTKYAPAVPGLGWAQNQAWCQTWQAWIALKAGTAKIEPVTASCLAATAWFKARKRFSEYPAIGAHIFFGANGGSHVGRVAKYDETHVWTYEGNTNDNGSAEGNGVYYKKRTRRDPYVHGYGMPNFVEGVTTADPALKGKSGFTYKAAASAPSVPAAPKPEPRKLEWQGVAGFMPELKYGDENWHVDYLQRQLNRFIAPNLKVDGKYGQATADAVHKFYKEQLAYTTTTKGRVFSAGGWRRVLSVAADSTGKS